MAWARAGDRLGGRIRHRKRLVLSRLRHTLAQYTAYTRSVLRFRSLSTAHRVPSHASSVPPYTSSVPCCAWHHTPAQYRAPDAIRNTHCEIKHKQPRPRYKVYGAGGRAHLISPRKRN
eukprot:1255700-Rhodomonas_salina.1